MFIGPMMELEPQDIVQWVRGGASQRAVRTLEEILKPPITPRGYWDRYLGGSLWDLPDRSYWDGVEW
jgi:hypothetical protein